MKSFGASLFFLLNNLVIYIPNLYRNTQLDHDSKTDAYCTTQGRNAYLSQVQCLTDILRHFFIQACDLTDGSQL